MRDNTFSLLQNGRYSSTSDTLRLNAAYTWTQTIGISFGYHRYSFVVGDLHGYIAELSYTPFGKPNNPSWLNLRLNLTYTGSLTDSRLADTLYLNGSLAF